MHVLYVTPYVPSRIRTRPYNLIKALARCGHTITLLTASTSAEEQAQAEHLRSYCHRVEVFPVPKWCSLLNCARALPSREPLQAMYCYSAAMECRIAQIVQQEPIDVVHIEHLRAARLGRAVQHVPKVYDSVDCISLLFERAWRNGARLSSRLMAGLDLARTRRYEARLLGQYAHIVITSGEDKRALESLGERYLSPASRKAPVTVVTNGVDLRYFSPREDHRRGDGHPSTNSGHRTLVFTGKMSYHANMAAVLHFARQILPRIWAVCPNVCFQVVGKDPPPIIQALALETRVEVTGYVDDLRPYLAQASVAVCPTGYAVGIQNKVLEAMAMGTPIVSTPQGSMALAAQDGRDLLVAVGEIEFAEKVSRVLNDEQLARRLAQNGRRYVETYHDWETVAATLEGIYEQVVREQ